MTETQLAVAPIAEPQPAPLMERPQDDVSPWPVSPVERMATIRGWLHAGKPPSEIIPAIQRFFGVKQRMAYNYLAMVRRQLIEEARAEGRSFHLLRTQIMRDKLFDSILARFTRGHLEPDALRPLATMLTALNRVLEGRDKGTERLYSMHGTISPNGDPSDHAPTTMAAINQLMGEAPPEPDDDDEDDDEDWDEEDE